MAIERGEQSAGRAAAARGQKQGSLLGSLKDALRAAGREFVVRERNWARSVARYRPVFERLAGR